MAANLEVITENYKRITDRIAEAKAKYRSEKDEIMFLGVTKTVAPEIINHSVDLGIRNLGENRVQEYLSKKDFYRKNVNMHFIGHLQTNKVKYIINDMVLIHSVDSMHLAAEISRQAAKAGKVQDILIEVNIGDEQTKSGIDKNSLEELVYEAAELDNIRIKGLMCIPPASDSEKYLCSMQQIFEDMKQKKINNCLMDILSMGMSGDYENAIRYGSTCVRIGSALYGARNYNL